MIRPFVKVFDTSVFCDKEQFNNAYALMSEERKRKIDALSSDKDKRLSLGAGVLFEEGVKAFGVDDSSLRYGEHKKPYLKENDKLFFSISHSGEYCACAFYDKEIGIDIQKIKDVSDAVIKKVATDKEYDYLSSLDNIERRGEFTRLWTVKESYVKFLGKGLSLSFQKIEMTFDEEIKLIDEGKTADVIFEEQSIDGYKLTVCYKRENTE